MEPILSLVPRVEALASPNLSKRATPKAPRLCTYIESTLDNERQNHPKPMRAVYNTPHEAFCIALFLTNCVVNCQIPTRQNQSVQKRLLSLCMSAQPLPIGTFGMGKDYAKITLLLLKPLFLLVKFDFKVRFNIH